MSRRRRMNQSAWWEPKPSAANRSARGSVVVAVPDHQLPLLTVGEALLAVLPDGPQHLVPRGRVAGCLDADHDRLVHQARDQVQDVGGGDPLSAADLLRSLEVEASREDREPRPQELLCWRAQLVAPAHGGIERLVPRCCRSAAGEQPEAVLEPVEDLHR